METHQVIPQRSSVSPENYQEALDNDEQTGMGAGSMAQYFTPDWFVTKCEEKLPSSSPATILDPSCGQGALLMRGSYGPMRYGVELDQRIEDISGVQLITGGCQKVFEIVRDIYPHLRWVCANSNPPFNRRWKQPDGTLMDSTEATWNFVTAHANYGYFITNYSTAEKLNLAKHPFVYEHQCFKGNEIWKGMRDDFKIIVLWWKRPESRALQLHFHQRALSGVGEGEGNRE